MTVGTIHRVLRFTQSSWMEPYIDFNTKLRQAARNDFERDLFKLMNNACFGKSLENVKLRRNIELISDARKFLRLVAKPQLETFKILNENTVLIDRIKETAVLDKPIYAGFCILDLSKVLMYEFHYDVIMKMYGDNARLLFTDTDSLCYCIKTDDVYADMLPIRDEWLDTSAFPKSHKLYSELNKKVPGKMKFEGNEVVYTRFVGLRAKMYSIVNYDSVHSKMTAKGVKKHFIKSHVKHDMYLKTLLDRKCTYADFNTFRSRSHKIESVKLHRVCLSAYDDKRYVLDDGISTLAYGHISLQKSPENVDVV
jgi:hypothetical protein